MTNSIVKNKLNASYRKLFLISLMLLCFVTSILFAGCKKSVDYFSYVSELRNNIFCAEYEGFSLRIYSVKKETPYVADGIAHESTARTEIYLLAPDGSPNYTLWVQIEKEKYGGELSYDNIKSEYFLSFSLDTSDFEELPCILQFEETQIQLTATSVLSEETLSPNKILDTVREHSPELFAQMTDKYGFAGEIYLRLLYEEAPYYYVGVINRNGEINAFLVNAKTGKVLARRTP